WVGVLQWGICYGLDEGEDVLLRHAAAGAGALHGRGVDAVLGGDPGDDRRDEGVAVAAVAVPGGRGRRWRGGLGRPSPPRHRRPRPPGTATAATATPSSRRSSPGSPPSTASTPRPCKAPAPAAA